jgi:hypothetical protein
MPPTRSTLSEVPRAQSINPVNRGSTALIDLRGQTNEAQWNRRGPFFIELCEVLPGISLEVGACSDLLLPRVGPDRAEACHAAPETQGRIESGLNQAGVEARQ